MANKDWITEYVNGANGRQKTFSNGGYIIDVSIPEESMSQLTSFTTKNGKKYFTFKISPLRGGEDKYGNTHSVFVSKKADEVKDEDPFDGAFDDDDNPF